MKNVNIYSLNQASIIRWIRACSSAAFWSTNTSASTNATPSFSFSTIAVVSATAFAPAASLGCNTSNACCNAPTDLAAIASWSSPVK